MPIAVLKHPFPVVYSIVLKGFLGKRREGRFLSLFRSFIDFFPTEILPTFDERYTTMIPRIPERTRPTFGNCYFINNSSIFHFF